MTNFYFAYGSKMDEGQMVRRCPGAEAFGTAILPDYQFIINERGVATLRPEQGSRVPGLVWKLSMEHERELDRYEGYRAGLYDKCFRMVRTENREDLCCLVYIDHRNQSPGALRDGYLEKIAKAATAHGLSQGYVQMLQEWPRSKGPVEFNRLVNQIKSGKDAGAAITCHNHAVAKHVKTMRDEFVLRALNKITRYDADGFEEALADVILREALAKAGDLDTRNAGQCALEHVSLACLRERINALRDEKKLRDSFGCIDGPDELASQGIIITGSPERNHAPNDHFVVSVGAYTFAALWQLLFEGAASEARHAGPFMEAFATAAESHRNTAPTPAEHQCLLDRIEALAIQRQRDLLRETFKTKVEQA